MVYCISSDFALFFTVFLVGDGSKKFEDWGGGRLKKFRTGGVTDLGGGGIFAWGGDRGSVPHYMPCMNSSNCRN